MVFQGGALYPHLSVAENLAFGLRLQRRPRQEIEQRVAEAARWLGLEELLARRPDTLSGGQRQRVAIGRALVRRPAVYLLDEPLSGLDAQLRLELRREVKALHRELRTTMLLVTHDQAEAMALAERIAVLKEGALQQVGAPGELYQSPANVFVAGFLGSPPCNLVPGIIQNDRGQWEFGAEGGLGPLTFPAELTASWRQPAGNAVVLGIRPEHLRLGAGEDGANSVLGRGIVDAVEELGAEQVLHCRIGPHRLRLRRDGSSERVYLGDTVTLMLDPRQVHIFAGDTGESLRRA
jgi:ABC-type sugar transport system ATPase subunit